MDHITPTRHLSGTIYHSQVGGGTYLINLHTKFEVSIYTRFEVMKGSAKCGVVIDHLRSSAMSPFDRVHTTSYSFLV